MRIKDIDSETMAKIITRCERNYRDESQEGAGADGVQVFLRQVEAAIDKHVTQTFLEAVQNVRRNPVRIVGGFCRWSVYKQPRFEIGRCHSSFPASAK